MRALVTLLTLTLLLCRATVPVPAGENYALLVAVQDYDEKELRPLQFTRADILDFREALLESGFKPQNVIVLHDDLAKLVSHYQKLGRDYSPKDYLPEAAKIRKQLELVLGLLQKDDSIVVAFTGHGVQFANEKKSYYCPADAKLDDRESLVSLDEIYAHLKGCEAARKLLLVDACQNDPQSRIGKSRKTVDLASVTRPQSEPVPEGIIALFSCRAGQQSFEHPPLGHGIFFHHVLDGWKGKADLNGDRRLSYLELAQYAEKQTAEYAYLKLKVSQKPQLKAEFSGEWTLRELPVEIVMPPLFDATRGQTAAAAKGFQDAWARHLKMPVEIENGIGMSLRLIPPGEYLRGEAGSRVALASAFRVAATEFDDEQPQHTVRISKPFLMGAAEVTRGQFRRFVSATGHVTETERTFGAYRWNESGGGFDFEKPDKKINWNTPGFPQTDDHPVVNITWNDASEFCEWLSREEGKVYRLPTEAEWEYACRAGTTTRYHTGDDVEAVVKSDNVSDGTFKARYPIWTTIKASDGYALTAPVKKLRPNAFGLYDMHGNVGEYCSNWYDAKEYAKLAAETAVDPQGPTEGTEKVARGGSWINQPVHTRTAHRGFGQPSNRINYVGFRVVMEPRLP